MLDLKEAAEHFLGTMKLIGEIQTDILTMAFIVLPDDSFDVIGISNLDGLDAREEVKLFLSERIKESKAVACILLADAKQHSTGKEALTVTVWGPGMPSQTGFQLYTRDSQGKRVWGKFEWSLPGMTACTMAGETAADLNQSKLN